MYITESVLWIIALLLCGSIVNSKSIPDEKNSSMLVSEYAKVAHWGSARSSKGQMPWTHRSDASVIYGQNLENFHNSYDTSEIPAVGEVQERFNLRPYFQYELSPGSDIPIKTVDNKKPMQDSSSPPLDYPVYVPTSSSVKALPVPLLPTVQPVSHEDPYTSSYSSYNPPQKPSNSDDSHSDQQSKPHLSPITHSSFNSQSDLNESNGSYLPQLDSVGNNDKPPLFTSDNSNVSDMKYYDSSVENDYPQMMKFSAQQEKPVEEFDHHYQDAHGQKGHDDLILDNHPAGYGTKEPDMAPPPLPDNFRHYSYEEDQPDHHHVYHEIEKPNEEKRVSKPQYSYYYIGRKLWYIPLYFSVYFIIYVTFLILKSIARHKIQFKHDFADHHARKSRQMTDNDLINNIHNNVSRSLLEGKKKFPLVLM